MDVWMAGMGLDGFILVSGQEGGCTSVCVDGGGAM
jgi:hypothetical protein